MAASAAWLYWTGDTGWAIALLIWSAPLMMLDNVLRPVLIRRGVQLPLLLVVAGVIGGLIGFGVVGLFIGPVVLAVTYTLVKEWVAADPRRPREMTSSAVPAIAHSRRRVFPPLSR